MEKDEITPISILTDNYIPCDGQDKDAEYKSTEEVLEWLENSGVSILNNELKDILIQNNFGYVNTSSGLIWMMKVRK